MTLFLAAFGKFVIIKNRYEVLFEFENRYVVLEYVSK